MESNPNQEDSNALTHNAQHEVANSSEGDANDLGDDPAWQELQDDYELLGHIGSGSFGQVEKAIHRETGKLVAIKLMKNLF